MKLPVYVYQARTELKDSYFDTFYIYDDADEEVCEVNSGYELAVTIAEALNESLNLAEMN